MALEEALRRCYPVLLIEDDEKREIVERVVRPFVLDPDTVLRVRNTLRSEMDLGLLPNPERPSSLQMDVAHIPELPDGTETGHALALDLGGTNFRVLHLYLTPGSPARCRVQHYAVPSDVRKGSGERLFDFLADCLRDFVGENGLTGTRLPLGFCFSFPIVHKALDAAVLTEWVVSYDCSGVVGEDVGRMLEEAIRRRTNIDVELVAIVNDTTGTLVQGAFMDSDCAIGLIMEWGAFGDNGVLDFAITPLDRLVDDQSLFPGSFTFEKLLSGEFLGDVVRQILIEIARRRALFGGDETAVQKADGTRNLHGRRPVLVSVCLAELLERVDKPTPATIAVDGSLYKYHPTLRGHMRELVTAMAPGRPFKLMLAESGSGKGAGLIAAVVERLRSTNRCGNL
ncbi:hypothetical protein HPB50_018198 [Hyalomma asiaticum]|uniref:Uncharacterized protein n=1 Tax=Hyalomma asiaticum TaxID=266040 RepID=A0ACB7TK55_HYAAI|nr:hypothetical protein HPB50_018198 [Hyalomma asiaticum]